MLISAGVYITTAINNIVTRSTKGIRCSSRIPLRQVNNIRLAVRHYTHVDISTTMLISAQTGIDMDSDCIVFELFHTATRLQMKERMVTGS